MKRSIAIIVLALTVSYGSVATVQGGNVPAPPSAAPQMLAPEIFPQTDTSCVVYPIGDPAKTELHPLFGLCTGPEGYRVTKDLANVQTAVMYFSQVTLKRTNLLGVPTAFHFGTVDYASLPPSSGGLPNVSVMITKDVIVEGEEHSPFGRATIVGGSMCFAVFPNQALYYDVGTFRMRVKSSATTQQCYWPIPNHDLLPAVTLRHLDSEQASLDFIILKAARSAIIDDVRVTNMAKPWENLAGTPFGGQWLFPIEIVPGAVLIYGPDYIQNVVISHCLLSPTTTSINTVGILVQASAGTHTFANNSIEASYGGMAFLNSPTAVATIQNNDVSITPSTAPPVTGVPSCGIGLVSGNGATVKDNRIRGTGSRGLALLGNTSSKNIFENIDMREFTPVDTYVWCNTGATNNTGTNIGVPAGTCGRYIKDDGKNNTFNRLPEISPINNQMVYVGSPFGLQVLAADEAFDVLTYRLTVNGPPASPQWLSIDSTSGYVQGTPTKPGSYNVTAMVSDNKDCSYTASTSFLIDVRCPPIVVTSLAASPNLLWPPNHKVIPVALSATTSGGCGRVSCQIVGVSSNEPASADGDWQITGLLTLLLRAERLGAGSGRVYTITVQCTDEEGNTASRIVTVTVPHDQGK